jgi:hypothetical protein
MIFQKNDLDLAQLKLTNGSEIVCEIMEWPEEDDNQIIARNTMTIINIEYEGGDRAFAFRPWIQFLEDDKDYIIINSDHIISLNRPTEYLVEQYKQAVLDSHHVARERKEAYVQDKLEGLNRIANALDSVLKKKTVVHDEQQSETNIIRFPSFDDDEGTIH